MTLGRRFRVRGRVQGVWFRESTRQQAARLGLGGHAVNLTDGSVEVEAWGEAMALAQLEVWLHEGPRLARVASVSAADIEGQAPGDFTTG